jgi:hypothetical protein
VPPQRTYDDGSTVRSRNAKSPMLWLSGLARSAKWTFKLVGYALCHLLIDQPPSLPRAAGLRTAESAKERTDAALDEGTILRKAQLAAEK